MKMQTNAVAGDDDNDNNNFKTLKLKNIKHYRRLYYEIH